MFEKVRQIKEKKEEELKKVLTELWEKRVKLEKNLAKLFSEYEELRIHISSIEGIYRLRAITEKINDIKEKIKKLEEEERKVLGEIFDVKREIKALEIVEEKKERENLKREISLSIQELSFINLLKKVLSVCILFFGFTFSESAVQKSIKKDLENNLVKDYKMLLNIIERKLKELKEERERLKALKSEALSEEEEKKVEKIVKAIGKAPGDEIAPMVENLPPKLAAEVLLRLKERKAGEILANMNPQKASEIVKYILSRNPEFARKISSTSD